MTDTGGAVLARRLLALFLFAAAADAQLLRVDCGDLNGFATGEPGYQLLTESGGVPGVSLTPAALDTAHVGSSIPQFGTVVWPSDVQTLDPDQIDETHRNTALVLGDDTVLSIAGLAPGARHRVKLELGALFPWIELNPSGVGWDVYASVSRQVEVEARQRGGAWVPLARDLRCTTGLQGNTFKSDLGGIVTLWVSVDADAAGVARLRFSTAGADPVFLAAFEVHDYEPLPLQYRGGPGGPLVGFAPEVAAFVAAFNAGDFTAAQLEAEGLADDWLRGVALTHLVGWLDGSRDGLVHLAPDARAALQAAAAQHPGAAWLIAQLDQFQRALDHVAARGYSSWYACPDEGGRGFLNPDCEGQTSLPQGQADSNVNLHIALRELSGLIAPAVGTTVLDDLIAWTAGAGLPAEWEPSPLVMRAAKQYLATIAMINPLMGVANGDAESTEFLQRFEDLASGFVDLGFVTQEVPAEIDLYVYDKIAELGEHPKGWDDETIEGLLTDEQIAASWWGEAVALTPDDPTVPDWVRLQDDFARLYRNGVAYWLTERFVDGEYGGGLGDDVELVLQLFLGFAAVQTPADRPLIDRLEASMRYALVENGVVAGGYYAGEMTDVEHSAEYTTNPWIATRGIAGRSARTARVALGVTEHLRDADDPANAWAAPTLGGNLHFKSFHFTAQGPSPNPSFAQETLLVGRAMMPATLLLGSSALDADHPLRADYLEWARSWRDDALTDPLLSNGKPSGFMGPVRWPTNEYGIAGVWYSDNGAVGNVKIFDPGELSYTFQALSTAYRASDEPDRYTYLIPAALVLRTVMDWEDLGEPFAPAGSPLWSARELRDGLRFGPIVYAVARDLLTDPDLATLLDPATGSPYVDAALAARITEWLEQDFVNQGAALRYALGPTFACGTGPVKNVDEVLAAYEKAIAYLRVAYPVLTKGVMHTDRVFLSQFGGIRHLVQGHTGSSITEGLAYEPRASWRLGPDGPPRIAVQANELDVEGERLSAFVHSFGDVAAPAEVRLEEGLVPGRYRVEWGAAIPSCDQFPAGLPPSSTIVDKPGVGVAVPLVLQPGLNLVRVERVGAATSVPGGHDFALDAPRIELALGQTAELVLSTSVANAGGSATPPASLRLYGSARLPDGSFLEITGFGTEVLLGIDAIPSLAPTSDWTLSETTLTRSYTLTPAISSILGSGVAIGLRAEIDATSVDADALNDGSERAFFLEDIAVIDG